jgi:hypothetical protein
MVRAYVITQGVRLLCIKAHGSKIICLVVIPKNTMKMETRNTREVTTTMRDIGMVKSMMNKGFFWVLRNIAMV